MKIRYFAWIRERIGLDEEEVALPAGIITVEDLILWLKGRSSAHADALQAPKAVRVAIDQEHAEPLQPIAGAREIAIFPPMTGG